MPLGKRLWKFQNPDGPARVAGEIALITNPEGTQLIVHSALEVDHKPYIARLPPIRASYATTDVFVAHCCDSQEGVVNKNWPRPAADYPKSLWLALAPWRRSRATRAHRCGNEPTEAT